MWGEGQVSVVTDARKIKCTILVNDRLFIHFTVGPFTDNCCQAHPTLRPFYQSAIVRGELALSTKRVES